MKRILVILSAVSSIILFSCQKEVDYADRGGDGGGTLLIKRVDKTGSDSLVNVFKYNVNNKITNLKITGTDQGSAVNREYRYYRNSSGILTYYSIIDAELISLGVDSGIVDIHYASSRYNSYVTKYELASVMIYIDSTVIIYDGAGNITRLDVYESQTGAGNDYFLSGKINFIYSGGNISQLDIHDLDDTGTETFFVTEKINYDSKINPLHFDNEVFPMGHYDWISPNNIAGLQVSTSNGPSDDQTIGYTYTYNNNRPKIGTYIVMPGGETGSSTFYYQ